MAYSEPRTRQSELTWRIDLVARECPMEAIVLRFLLQRWPACAMTVTHLSTESGLLPAEVATAVQSLLAVGGVRVLAHPSGRRADDIVWMQPMVSMQRLCANTRWVAAWFRDARTTCTRPTVRRLRDGWRRQRRATPHAVAEDDDGWVTMCVAASGEPDE